MLKIINEIDIENSEKVIRQFSRRDAIKLGGALLASVSVSGCFSNPTKKTVLVGDPNQPTTLPASIIDAYNLGARDITIRQGVYVLPATKKNGIELAGWNNAIIRFKGTIIIFEDVNHRPIMLSKCNDVVVEDAVLQFAGISYTQGRIQALGEDVDGKYLDWQIDTGYPIEIDPSQTTYNVIDQNTRLLKVGTGDSAARETTTRGLGFYRLRKITGMMQGASVGDWLVCRAKGGTSIIQLDSSKNCTLRRIILKNSGFAAFFETGGDGANHYVDCLVTRGPKPVGAVEEQLISCGADGFHSTGTRIGPTIERCTWDGVLLDDCIAIHGSLQNVIRVEDNKLILAKGNRAGFAINEPVRISSGDGFFGQARCIGMRTLGLPDEYLELTLDEALSVPAGAKAGNPERCGKSFKIIDCKLGNTRSRGILVKADDGLIKNCFISGCGMSAVSIGPEYYWNEGNYSWNVTVTGNRFFHNALRNSLNADGVVFIHGDGAIGNRNIIITHNRFQENYSPYMINIAWADKVRIADNVINSPSPLSFSDPGYIISLNDVRQITFEGNTYSHPGPSIVQAVGIGKNVEGVIGNDDSGIRALKK